MHSADWLKSFLPTSDDDASFSLFLYDDDEVFFLLVVDYFKDRYSYDFSFVFVIEEC